MVRVNLIDPKNLSDQHLIAEYNELLMLTSYIRKHPRIGNIPKKYCLGRGHMLFFKNKVSYLKKRHERIRKEMLKRGFRANKKIRLNFFKKENKKDWLPKKQDLDIIKKRLITKLRLKPDYYRYYKKSKPANFFIKILKTN